MTTTSELTARAIARNSTYMTYEAHRLMIERERRGKDILCWICFALFVICLVLSARIVYG
jgi:hypothetical protein